ncbi:MAG: PIN domain-containing protein, partial [Leptolyngbya sp. SIO4C1]|nr:PIN domain-containing protein [Leptolyngbya sp. SIO4C1]
MVNRPTDIHSFDSNVWIYRFMVDPEANDAEDSRKHRIAAELTSRGNIALSIQIINEVCAVLLRKANFTESQVRQLVEEFYSGCDVLNIGRHTVKQASELRERYRFSYWDSL